MRRAALLACCMLALGCRCAATLPASSSKATETMQEKFDYDVRVIGGDVIDGTGAPRTRADIGIRGDTIATIGDLSGATARTTIDARGQVVTPGFIDVLGHSEGSVLIDPHLEGKIRQGVTTESTGEGHSPGPLDEAMAAEMTRTRPPGFPAVTWRSLGDYMKFVEALGTAINFALYVGSANPREIVLGKTNRNPSPEDTRKMEAIVDAAMRDGAVGMSSALIYVPARYAKTSELIALARVVASHGGAYWTHIRNESDRIDAALDEAFEIGREAKIAVNIFHLKIGGRRNWGRMPEIVARIEAARASGLDVQANVYPYVATSTELTAIIPDWAMEGGYDAFRERLRDPALRARVVSDMKVAGLYSRLGTANNILVRSLRNPQLAKYERKRLDEIARDMSADPAEAALRLFDASEATPMAIYFSMSEEDVKTALKQPWVSIGSDSGAVVGFMKEKGAHPRAYGTFPRVLGHYVRDEQLFTLEEAVRKMTSLAASRVYLKDRGVLREGMKADVVVFDPATIRDVSTYEDPHHDSEGISNVLVNGVPVLLGGKMTDALPGRILRHRNSAF